MKPKTRRKNPVPPPWPAFMSAGFAHEIPSGHDVSGSMIRSAPWTTLRGTASGREVRRALGLGAGGAEPAPPRLQELGPREPGRPLERDGHRVRALVQELAEVLRHVASVELAREGEDGVASLRLLERAQARERD